MRKPVVMVVVIVSMPVGMAMLARRPMRVTVHCIMVMIMVMRRGRRVLCSDNRRGREHCQQCDNDTSPHPCCRVLTHCNAAMFALGSGSSTIAIRLIL